MRHEPLVVYREECLCFSGMEPHTIGEMWRDRTRVKCGERKYPVTSMQAAAWLILHYGSLRDGHWPEVLPEEIPTHGGAYHHGPQEIPCIYAAEISVRIKETGRDGDLLWAYYGDSDEPVIPAPEQNRLINRALEYCSGWKRKRRVYQDWYGRHYSRREYHVIRQGQESQG